MRVSVSKEVEFDAGHRVPDHASEGDPMTPTTATAIVHKPARDLARGDQVVPSVSWSSAPTRVVDTVTVKQHRVEVRFEAIQGWPTTVFYDPTKPVAVATPVPARHTVTARGELIPETTPDGAPHPAQLLPSHLTIDTASRWLAAGHDGEGLGFLCEVTTSRGVTGTRYWVRVRHVPTDTDVDTWDEVTAAQVVEALAPYAQ